MASQYGVLVTSSGVYLTAQAQIQVAVSLTNNGNSAVQLDYVQLAGVYDMSNFGASLVTSTTVNDISYIQLSNSAPQTQYPYLYPGTNPNIGGYPAQIYLGVVTLFNQVTIPAGQTVTETVTMPVTIYVPYEQVLLTGTFPADAVGVLMTKYLAGQITYDYLTKTINAISGFQPNQTPVSLKFRAQVFWNGTVIIDTGVAVTLLTTLAKPQLAIQITPTVQTSGNVTVQPQT